MPSGPHLAPAVDLGFARVFDHTGAAAQLVARSGAQLERAIEDYAVRFAQELGVDSLKLSSGSADEREYRTRVEWFRAGFHCVVSQRSGDHLFGEFPWFSAELERQGWFVVDDVTELPAEARAERRFMERTGRRAMISSTDTRPAGSTVVLTLGQDARARSWSPQDIEGVRLANALLGAALRRLDSEGRSRLDFSQLFRDDSRPLAVVDPACERFLMVNDEFARLHGYDTSALAGQSLRTISPERNSPPAMSAISALRERGHYVFDVLHRRRDGSVFPCRVDARRVAPDEPSAGYIVVLNHLSDAASAPQQDGGHGDGGTGAVATNVGLQSLGLLAGGIAHDFNNLLVGILGNAELARMNLPEGTGGAKALDDLRAAATRASGLANQMLAYAGKRRLKPEPLDLCTELHEMGQALGGSLHKGAQLRLECDDSIVVMADATHMRQIVMNLIVNASDAMAAKGGGGEIVLRAGRVSGVDADSLAASFMADPTGDFVFLEVQDEGGGMTQAVQSRIFDAFFTTKVSGRGLGMATVLECVRQHGGGVRVRSEPGKGTAIRVFLPDAGAQSEDVEPRRPRRLGVAEPRKGKVLIAEDEGVVRTLLRRLLERRGLTVVEATDGLEAQARFDEHDDLAFAMVDVSMPRMDGITLIKALPPTNSTPIVVMSGYASQDIAVRSSSERTIVFLQKPFEVWELDDVVDRFLPDRSVDPSSDIVE